jgi:hypothetical protein
MKMFNEWDLSNGEKRMIEDISFAELDGLLATFYHGTTSSFDVSTLSGST